MRIRPFAFPAVVVALLASATPGDAVAFTASIAVSKDKTTAYIRPGGPKMTPYATTIHQMILGEVKRTHLPFAIAANFVFIVRFDLDRRGQLIDVKVVQGSNLAEADEYAELIVRRASRNFPPPPASLPGERLAFMLPLAMEGR